MVFWKQEGNKISLEKKYATLKNISSKLNTGDFCFYLCALILFMGNLINMNLFSKNASHSTLSVLLSNNLKKEDIIMPRRLSVLATIIGGIAFSQVAMAELYISPVLRDTVSYSNDTVQAKKPITKSVKAVTSARKMADEAIADSQNSVIKGKSTIHGGFEMKKVAPAQKAEGTLFGKNVPLFVALENLVPQSKSWNIVFEPGTENTPVSWSAAHTWKEAVVQISKGSRLIIAINEGAKRISVARTADMAKQLAQPGQGVWQLKTSLSLRGNIEEWAKKSGWKLDWGSTQIDYPVDHATTLVGNFSGRGGVVDRVLSATSGREVPLTAKFYKGNNVVLIQEAGYKPEVPVSPVTDNESY